MATRVVSDPNPEVNKWPKNVVCKVTDCGVTLEYDESDVCVDESFEREGPGDDYFYVICQNCGARVVIPSKDLPIAFRKGLVEKRAQRKGGV